MIAETVRRVEAESSCHKILKSNNACVPYSIHHQWFQEAIQRKKKMNLEKFSDHAMMQSQMLPLATVIG